MSACGTLIRNGSMLSVAWPGACGAEVISLFVMNMSVGRIGVSYWHQ